MFVSLLSISLIGLAFGGWLGCRREVSEPAAASVAALVPAEDETEEVVSRGRLAESPDAALLASARELLGQDGRRELCGPYPLYTDVSDRRLIEACGRLVVELDDLYTSRYGLRPVGESAEAIILFAEVRDYRVFASQGGVPLGYAGYALGARGLAVFYAEGQALAPFLSTLTHELTHLLNRRALGVNLPPWLSEGLADGIGDTATASGFRSLAGIAGSEAQAQRLRQALATDRVGSLEGLVRKTRREFDRGVVSFDYEQSALFVRFLLSEPTRAEGFRTFLRHFASGEVVDSPSSLADALDATWQEIDRQFEAWALASR